MKRRHGATLAGWATHLSWNGERKVIPTHLQLTKDPNTKDAEVEVEQDPLTGGKFARL